MYYVSQLNHFQDMSVEKWKRTREGGTAGNTQIMQPEELIVQINLGVFTRTRRRQPRIVQYAVPSTPAST